MIHQKERFGGELVNLSQEMLDPLTKVETIYAILHRYIEFEIVQLKVSKTQDGVTRGTSRKYYSLTKAGVDYYKNLMHYIDSIIPQIFVNSIKKEDSEI